MEKGHSRRKNHPPRRRATGCATHLNLVEAGHELIVGQRLVDVSFELRPLFRRAACKGRRPGNESGNKKAGDQKRALTALQAMRHVRVQRRQGAGNHGDAVQAIPQRCVGRGLCSKGVAWAERASDNPKKKNPPAGRARSIQAGTHLRQKHQQAIEALDEVRVRVGLQQLQPQVGEDGRLYQLDELVDLRSKKKKNNVGAWVRALFSSMPPACAAPAPRALAPPQAAPQ